MTLLNVNVLQFLLNKARVEEVKVIAMISSLLR